MPHRWNGTARNRRRQTSDGNPLRQTLSELTLDAATQLLGPAGPEYLSTGERFPVDPRQIYLGDDLFRITFPSEIRGRARAIVTLTVSPRDRRRLECHCTACPGPCPHVGAALAYLLEEKAALGLVAAPRHDAESLSEADLVARALSERQQRADSERMQIVPESPIGPWTDYTVTSALSGKRYRVALRGVNPGDSYCTCPDFRANTLGTCKHILKVLERARRTFGKDGLSAPFVQRSLEVAVHYGETLELRFLMPRTLDSSIHSLIGDLRDSPIDDAADLLKRIRQVERLGHPVQIYPDAEELIQHQLHQRRIQDLVAAIRHSPDDHVLRTSLLKSPVLPYQLDGIAFAVGAGRAILADEMGLGKTVQGIGVAELLAREVSITRTLIVCPATLKAQWRSEIDRFCDRTVTIVTGGPQERAAQYAADSFYTICNYEQMLSDVDIVERLTWDLIILDEGQRIRNWESKTSRVIKGLRSRFALVLTGTPLENRLEDLFSIVQFIDNRRLGPGFRFFSRHRVVDDRGKIIGIRNLTELRHTLKPILLRRTRQSVRQQLPPCVTEILRIEPTEAQRELTAEFQQNVSRIVSKPFLTEMDLIRLQKELLRCRLAANCPSLVDTQLPANSGKLERLDELFEELLADDSRKMLVFSEWTSMLDLIEPMLVRRGSGFVRLDGAVPQRSRAALVDRFQTEPECRVFLATNAGATGLNLQAANTIVNVDLPWSPALLEQRIARAHRLGQQQPVDVLLLITTETLEERMLQVHSEKSTLALAVLDPDSDLDEVQLASQMSALRSTVEHLVTAKTTVTEVRGDSPADLRVSTGSTDASIDMLLKNVTHVLSSVVRNQGDVVAVERIADALRERMLQSLQHDESGRPLRSLPLPDSTVVQALTSLVAQWLGTDIKPPVGNVTSASRK